MGRWVKFYSEGLCNWYCSLNIGPQCEVDMACVHVWGREIIFRNFEGEWPLRTNRRRGRIILKCMFYKLCV